jgi:adenine deaminase
MLTANLLNLFDQTIFYGTLTVDNGRIARIERLGDERPGQPYILPGFIDAHVHIESSLLTPAQFARLAVVHGTVATVSDPHEIGNVLGVVGVEYMLADARRVPLKFCFGAPSCVPATTFETAGASIDVADVRQLLGLKEIGYLAEMMNFPGVLHQDADVMAKIALAKAFNKPIDGHAPGLTGEAAQQYIDAGISTDHECFSYEEGLDKARRGMNILIREGSAARNFDALIPLLPLFPGQIMFCSDDKHPDTLATGHINDLVRRAIALGHDRWQVLRAACLNPALHYRLPVGLLREGDPADFVIVSDLTKFQIQQTVIDGEVVAENGQSRLPDLRSEPINRFACTPKQPTDFAVTLSPGTSVIRVIEALDGQLITNELIAQPTLQDGLVMADPARDLLKITVVNRYVDAAPAVAFIKNMGLTRGAIASSVGHDSHNITAVGCDDKSLCRAVNAVIEAKGGLCAVVGDEVRLLPLPIAGLMTDVDGYAVAGQYARLDQFVKDELGSTLLAPFMTLSFMALLVIPSLKLSDRGLFDGKTFDFVPLSVF